MELRPPRKEVLGINARNLEFIYPLNPRRYFPLVDDKLMTKELLSRHGVPVPEILAEMKNLAEIDQALKAVEAAPSLVIKPASGRAGLGILVLERSSENRWVDTEGALWDPWALRIHISNILMGVYALEHLQDRAFIEEKVVNPELIARWVPCGVPDIRIITLKGNPVMAMLRLPTMKSRGKANLHQGAVGAGIFLEQGRTHHAILGNETILVHPDTKIPLAGLEIPRWKEVVAAARAAAAVIPLGYLGVDIVIDARRGPLVLELNARPGLQIQLANRMGLRSVLRENKPRD